MGRDARASVTLEGLGYRLRVSVVTPAGAVSERNIVASSCTEAAEAAVAILTVAVAPGAPSSDATVAPSRASSGSRADPGSRPAETPASRAAGAGSDDSENEGRGPPAVPLLAAALGVDLGTLAAPAPFARLAAGVEIGRFAALAVVGATGSVLGELEGGTAGAQMFLVMGGLLGCLRLNAGNPVVSGCAGVEIGSLEARGYGTTDPRDARAFWSASVIQGVLDWDVSSTSRVSLGVTGIVPFRELQVVASTASVHETAPVAVRPGVGVELRFR
jgi:hypothetical protein